MSLDNIGGINNAQQPNMKYDKTDIQKAMMNDNAIFNESENAVGKFIEIFDPDTNTIHTLVDYDKDGKVDAYARQEFDNENGKSVEYFDEDFDGEFDQTTYIRNTGNNSVILSFDYDGDGKVDDIHYSEIEQHEDE